jgi:hypothetical protein
MIGSSRTEAPFCRPSRRRRPGGDLEGERRRVHLVEGAVDELHLEVDHREAGDDARAHDRQEALLDARDVLLRDRAADDLGLEAEARALLVRLHDQLHAGELARAAGLLLVGVVDLRPAGDRLAVGHLRGAILASTL